MSQSERRGSNEGTDEVGPGTDNDRRDACDYADRIRGMIQHENDLINHRMTWLLAFQGILFAALSLAWSKGHTLPIVISFLGLVAARAIWVACEAADIAIRSLESNWGEFRQSLHREVALPPIIGLPYGALGKKDRLLPWKILPKALVLGWSVTFLAALARLYAVIADLLTRPY